jgi:hypothetical protein
LHRIEISKLKWKCYFFNDRNLSFFVRMVAPFQFLKLKSSHISVLILHSTCRYTHGTVHALYMAYTVLNMLHILYSVSINDVENIKVPLLNFYMAYLILQSCDPTVTSPL